MKNILKDLFKENGVKFAIFAWVLLMGVITVPKIFAAIQPEKSIEIFSFEADFKKGEAGAWKVTKSARWLSKDTAEITFDVNTIAKSNDKYMDILLVLDVSDSMNGERLKSVKSDVNNLFDTLLSNDKNRVSIITFGSSSEIVSNFTNDKDSLSDKINNLTCMGSTNYYQALKNVDSILKDYQKEKDRECVVLFLTDGYSNIDSPNEVSQYRYLKSKYSFITINGVQYEMGSEVREPIINISDNQYIADMETLNNVLFEASITSIVYDEFNINDFIDSTYFDIDEDISVSKGSVKYDKSNQKVDWSISNLVSGLTARMKIKIKLKEQYSNETLVYSTNSKEIINSKIGDINENIISLKTPALTKYYNVAYDGNEPSNCKINVLEDRKYSVFDTVNLDKNIPICDGYQFKGWDITTKNVESINDDYFIMPEEDVSIRAVWSKLDVKKKVDGKVQEKLTLYKQVQMDANDSGKNVKRYTGPTDSFMGAEDVYYYARDNSGVVKNNVIFANYCWNIIRTTDTGGVKLLYNGVPTVDGRCNSLGSYSHLTGEQMNTTGDRISFDNNTSSPADLGYMTNKRYNFRGRRILNYTYAIAYSSSMTSGSSFYYADSYTWNGSKYSLVDSEALSWADNRQNLVGKYTFGSDVFLAESEDLLYVLGTDENTIYYMIYNDGYDINTVGGEPTITVSKTINDNEEGSYTLTNPITISKADWHNVHETYNGYYTCGSNRLKCDGSAMKNILSTNDSSFTFFYVRKYGNSFVYENGQYRLVDTIDIADLSLPDVLNNNHYSCFNSSGVCKELDYIYYKDDELLYYIRVSGGKSITDALGEMFYNDNANSEDSFVKKAVDTWYLNYMMPYTSFLEDTVWCDNLSLDSRFSNTNGWNPNGGDTSVALYFKANEKSKDLSCKNKNDRFTVNDANGNGKLTYPVGLLTGVENDLISEDSGRLPYVFGHSFWLLSPVALRGNITTRNISRRATNGLDCSDGLCVVRPVISLRAGIAYSSGDGSFDRPYVIDLSNDMNRIIIDENSSVDVTKKLALVGESITLQSKIDGQVVKSFKLNGETIKGNSFAMLDKDVEITDIQFGQGSLVVESEHDPYSNNLNDEKEYSFPDATSLTVTLDIQTESTSYDYVYLYDSSEKRYGKYGGTTKVTENVTIPGNYVKILFHTDSSNCNYYGYKAIITPNYD